MRTDTRWVILIDQSSFSHSQKVLKVLENLDDPLPKALITSYPKVYDLIENPSPPVVLELQGLGAQRLLTEQGDEDIRPLLERYWKRQGLSGVASPDAFRVREVSPVDIVAVRDLRTWRPEDIGTPPLHQYDTAVSA